MITVVAVIALLSGIAIGYGFAWLRIALTWEIP